MTVQNVSLLEELQRCWTRRSAWVMVGNDMGKFMQYQTAQSHSAMAQGAGAAALRAMPGPGAGWHWARCWRRTSRKA